MSREMIHKSIEIDGSRESVWMVLTTPVHAGVWMSEFSEGSHVDGEFGPGETLYLKNGEGDGLRGKVTAWALGERLKIAYDGVLVKGVETPDSPGNAEWNGCFDAYTLSANGEKTILAIESFVPGEYAEETSGLWDKAIRKIKELSER